MSGEHRQKLLSLVISCPVASNDPQDCPLCGIRGESDLFKQEWVDSLSDSDVLDVLEFHATCFKCKSDVSV